MGTPSSSGGTTSSSSSKKDDGTNDTNGGGKGASAPAPAETSTPDAVSPPAAVPDYLQDIFDTPTPTTAPAGSGVLAPAAPSIADAYTPTPSTPSTPSTPTPDAGSGVLAPTDTAPTLGSTIDEIVAQATPDIVEQLYPDQTPALPLPAQPGSGVVDPTANVPSIADFYDDVTNPGINQVEDATGIPLGNTAGPGSGVIVPPVVTPVSTDQAVTPVATAPVVASPVEGAPPTVGDTQEDVTYSQAQGSANVDAAKRRRRRAGYAGTILTGPGGVGLEGSVGKTILGA